MSAAFMIECHQMDDLTEKIEAEVPDVRRAEIKSRKLSDGSPAYRPH